MAHEDGTGEAVKLYNRTKIEDAVLKDLLAIAGRLAGARTSKVVVQVTEAKGFGCSGTAYKCIWVKMRGNSVSCKGRKITTDGGYFVIRLPRWGRWGSSNVWSTDQAERFFSVAVHEWAHIRDYQRDAAGARLDWDRPGRGRRRMRHDARPEEERANAVRHDVLHEQGGYGKAYEEILALAMAMEETYPVKE